MTARPDYRERSKMAFHQAIERGETPMSAALRSVEKAFDKSYPHDLFKRRVRAMMRRPIGDSEWLRYRRIAEDYARISLPSAITVIERAFWKEKRSINNARRNFGIHSSRPRITLMILSELRLMLRWVWRNKPRQFVRWRDAVRGED